MAHRSARAVFGVALVLAVVACDDPSPVPDSSIPPADGLAALSGTWVAELHHNGTAERMSLELVPNDEATVVRAFVSIPALDLWDYSLGAASRVGEVVRAGTLELRYDFGGPRLRGTVPSGFVPLQTIEIELRPGDALERPLAGPALPSPEPIWRFETGGPIWASVGVDEDGVFVGSDDGNVYALGRDGAERWRLETGAPVRAEPVAHQSDVLVHSDDGVLYRVAARSGDLVWKAELADTPLRRTPYGAAGFRYDHYGSAPAVSGETIYVGHDRNVHALALATGDVVWTKELPDRTTSSPVVFDGRVYLGSFDGNVYALDAASGEVMWAHDTKAPVPSTVALHHDPDLVIVGSRSYELLALDRADASRVWTYYNWFSWVESSAVVANGTVYVGSSDRQRLNAIDAVRGHLVWDFDTNGSAWARPAVSRDTVWIGAVGVAGYLVPHEGGLFAVDRETGDGVWHFPSPKPDGAALWGFAASPAVSGGLVVAGGLDGRVVAFRQR